MRIVWSILGALYGFAVIEYRLMANMWPMFATIIVTYLGGLLIVQRMGLELPFYWPLAVMFVLVFGLGRLHDWLEANTKWYNQIRYTGEVLPGRSTPTGALSEGGENGD